MLHFLHERSGDQPFSRSSEDDRMAALLHEVSHRESSGNEDAWFVAGVLVATQSARIRDVASLALADMNAQEAGQSIAEVLRRPHLAQSAGTLLYALGELGLPLELDTLIGIVETGSYEARAMAIQLVRDGLVERASQRRTEVVQAKLRDLAAGEDPEKVEAAEEVLASLSALPARTDE